MAARGTVQGRLISLRRAELKQRYAKFNPKRKIRQLAEGQLAHFCELALLVQYGGNPEHKKNPGDFGLTPPALPRKGKSLCDEVQIFSRRKALELLRSGLKRGIVSEQETRGWPQNIWTVTKDGSALEAQLENAESGSYHGYPMPASDPFRIAVLEAWGAGK